MTSTEPTAPAHYLDSEFAAEALAEIVRYGMDNDRSPAEVASNVLAHLRMHMAAAPIATQLPVTTQGGQRIVLDFGPWDE